MAGIFEKPSTRTRVSISVATFDLGGVFLELPISNLQIARGESIRDTAEVLSRFVHAIAARVKKHSTLEELARWASVPVINLLRGIHPIEVRWEPPNIIREDTIRAQHSYALHLTAQEAGEEDKGMVP